jgi:hypothetical protein
MACPGYFMERQGGLAEDTNRIKSSWPSEIPSACRSMLVFVLDELFNLGY